ncbi:probable dolichyl pyrophosphate Man9GlcNAc2 alpha-1,3-glucosyltransferase [Drosophila grimshawi]|uniref:Alpha-1,3-glucosyltransferase n=1 Tax=Drosophila grimshawi TaxID=7222 RepID=B4JPP0_DROGR|nr:probable dolichyl pyrophosphate Man9GlcNAc2 alpha-1,3-glucosyltransferase [Drosophila grimshawi]EDV98870.1 GH13362 [Drosophila grimshawi]
MISELIAVAFAALSLRAIISMNSFSGYNKAPMFGDYEAQRHWQEVTVNLPAKQWYTNGTRNDLQYWGLDYPPLTAYHSYLVGRTAELVNSSYVELDTSRGIETRQHKSFMRLTVLAADAFVYIPAMIILAICMELTFRRTNANRRQLFVLLAIYPGQVLIDNGHFQYNNISLGLAALAIAAILYNKHYVAAFAFTLALNYKQMELYHALPFFAYLLSSTLSHKSFRSFAIELAGIASIVLGLFAILWFPWLGSLDATLQVLHRLFPIGRGVFEDKVANFWCSFNVVYKLKNHISNDQMAIICLGTTLLAVLPTNIHLFFRRSKHTFLLALFNTAAAFFLFSFQVHEKSILLVSLPAICLFPWWPREMVWFLEVSVFSMIPLLRRDNLLVPTIALMIIFHFAFKCRYFQVNKKMEDEKNLLNSIIKISESLMVSILVGFLTIEPTARLPDIWPLIISVISCGHICVFLVWGYIQQFSNLSLNLK